MSTVNFNRSLNLNSPSELLYEQLARAIDVNLGFLRILTVPFRYQRFL